MVPGQFFYDLPLVVFSSRIEIIAWVALLGWHC